MRRASRTSLPVSVVSRARRSLALGAVGLQAARARGDGPRAAAARQLVAERFAWDRCIDQLEHVLADVMRR